MIKIEENQKSEAQIRLAEKLERDKAKLQEQIRKDHKKIEELKRKAKSVIGEMFAEYLQDYYCFEGSELKEIVSTAMEQKAVSDKVAEIRSRTDADDPGLPDPNGKDFDNADGYEGSNSDDETDMDDDEYGDSDDEES